MNSNETEAKFTRRFIAVISMVLLFYAGCFAWKASFGSVPKDNVQNVNLILGFLIGTVVAAVIGFWLGTSRGSQTKDAALAAAALWQALPPPAAQLALPAPPAPVADAISASPALTPDAASQPTKDPQ